MRILVTFVLFIVPAVAAAADLHVDATAGLDAPGRGSAVDPLKTLTYALAQPLTFGDRVLIAAGTYDDVGNGEVFPLSLPAGVSLIGADADQTKLVSVGVVPWPYPLLDIEVPGGDLTAMVISGLHFDGNVDTAARGIRMPLAIDDSSVDGPVIRNNLFTRFRNPIGGRFMPQGAIHIEEFESFAGPAESRRTGRAIVTANRFIDNRVGLYLSIFHQNHDPPWYFAQDSTTVANNIFASNDEGVHLEVGSAPDASASSDVRTRIVNNTFIDNHIVGVSFIEVGNGFARAVVRNNIIVGGEFALSGEVAELGSNAFHDQTSGLRDHEWRPPILTLAELNALPAVDPAFPNIDADPGLTDRAAYDVHLLDGSPCIDVADDRAAPAVDLDSDPRPLDGDGDLIPRADIGADEVELLPLRLMRLVLTGIARPSPHLGDVLPFGPENPATPVVDLDLIDGASDTESGILGDSTRPFVLYEVDADGVTLFVVKDAVTDSVAFHVE